MAVSEQARRRLHEALEAQLGEDNAATLMESLPPAGWGDVATKGDLVQLHNLTQHDFRVVRAEMAQMNAELRADMTEMKAELRAEMADMKAELRGEITGLGGDLELMGARLRQELAVALDRQTFRMLSVMVAFATLAVAVLKL